MFLIRTIFFCLITLTVTADVSAQGQPEAEFESIEIESAYWFRYSTRSGDGTRRENLCLGRAKSEALPFLEEIVLRRARRDIYTYRGLPNWGGKGGFSASWPFWIRCSFSNGEVVDLNVNPYSASVVGTVRHPIKLSHEECAQLLNQSSWDPSFATAESGLGPSANEWISRNMGVDDLTLDGSPIFGDGGEVLKPVSAKRYSFAACQCKLPVPLHHNCPNMMLVGEADEVKVSSLRNVLYSLREVSYLLYPDGKREMPSWAGTPPLMRVVCTMNDGSEALLDYYKEPMSWCVKGEPGLFIDPSRKRNEKLISMKGWDPVGPPLKEVFTTGSARIVSAEMRKVSGKWGRRIEGRTVKYVRHFSWTAKASTLEKLERALSENYWVSVSRFSPKGKGIGSGGGSSELVWLECKISNGDNIRVYVIRGSRGSSRFNGKGKGSGYQLNLPSIECAEIVGLQGWVFPEEWETDEWETPEDKNLLSERLNKKWSQLIPQVIYEPDVDPPSVAKAVRISAGERTMASSDLLPLLSKAVHGMRRSVLKYSLDGKVTPVHLDEEPSQIIQCELSDGQMLTIHIFDSDQHWCVPGEGSYRLALSRNQKRRLLFEGDWKVID